MNCSYHLIRLLTAKLKGNVAICPVFCEIRGIMPAALPVDYRSIQVMFAQGHTLYELAEMSGVSVNTLKARSAREGWKTKGDAIKEAKQSKVLAVALSNGRMQPAATNGADLVALTLADRKKRTKLALSSYLEDASEELAAVPSKDKLSVTDAALQLATMASKVYPEDHQEAQVSLQFFSIVQERAENGQNESPERHIYDIPADPARQQSDGWATEVARDATSVDDPML